MSSDGVSTTYTDLNVASLQQCMDCKMTSSQLLMHYNDSVVTIYDFICNDLTLRDDIRDIACLRRLVGLRHLCRHYGTLAR